jgi:hypothetical protein
MRTDTHFNRQYILRELQAGRLRQGWGRRPEEDLHVIAEARAARRPLDNLQKQTWRGNRRLLPTQRDAVQIGDLIVCPHLPKYGQWTIVRAAGRYRYSIDDGRNFAGKPDFGHILPVEIVSAPVPWRDPSVSDRFQRAMRPRIRMWSLDHVSEEVERLARDFATSRRHEVSAR